MRLVQTKVGHLVVIGVLGTRQLPGVLGYVATVSDTPAQHIVHTWPGCVGQAGARTSTMGAGGSTGGKKGELLETMADHEESINCMCLSEDGSMLVTGSEDATARMWATKTEETECLGVLK